MKVVDGDDDRTLRGESAERAEERRRDGTLIGRDAAYIFAQQRDLEGAPLRRRQGRQDLVESIPEQVGEAGEGELYLGPSRAGGEHAVVPVAPGLDTLLPKPGLADARRALDDEACRPSRNGIEKPLEHRELVSPADDVCAHSQGITNALAACNADGRTRDRDDAPRNAKSPAEAGLSGSTRIGR